LKKYLPLAVFAAIYFSCPIISAVNISLDVYPSEEELFEALQREEIDFQTYLNLKEILRDGIDSTELYLLEEIPNVNYFLETYYDRYNALRQEQAENYLREYRIDRADDFSGFFRARQYRRLDPLSQNESQFLLRTKFDAEWSVDLSFSQDYEGRETIDRRSIIYNPRRGPVRKMVFGNFLSRFGLGLVVGYRGKFLDKADQPTEQTALFPLYGGFNGIYIEGGKPGETIKFFLHYDRDDNHSFKTVALNVARRLGRFQFQGTVLGSITENRPAENEYIFYNGGLFLRYDNDQFDAAFEAAYNKDANHAIPAFIFESGYRTSVVGLRLSAWNYGDDYFNLAGGARAGKLYQTVFIDSIELEYRDKHYNQSGFLLRSDTYFTDDIRGEIALTGYGANTFQEEVSFLAAVEYSYGDYSYFRLNYRTEQEERSEEIFHTDEIQLEYRYIGLDIYTRSYIGLENDRNGREYLSLFSRGSADIKLPGKLDYWFNLSRIDMEDLQVDYFYAYIKESLEIFSFFEMAAKYSYRYSRNFSDSYQSTFFIEALVKW